MIGVAERRRRGRPVVLAAAAGFVAAGIVGAFLASRSPVPAARGAPSLEARIDALALPKPVAPAFRPATPQPLAAGTVSLWAPVLRPVIARTAPRPDAPAVAHVPTLTPEDTTNLVVAVGRATDDAGDVWVRVQLAVLPNNTTGWVPRSALGGYVTVRTHLKIDRNRLTATLYRDGRPVFRAPVGIGQPAWPTPRGRFYVRNKLEDFANPAYGPLAFGTSARSPVLTDWPAGGYIGIHGTDQPELLPGRVSHGCIRLRNEDILRLDALMPVGTPITIA